SSTPSDSSTFLPLSLGSILGRGFNVSTDLVDGRGFNVSTDLVDVALGAVLASEVPSFGLAVPSSSFLVLTSTSFGLAILTSGL
ncbi:hypothetical protein Tco_0029393, partial [Tanacetum coccineum]